MESQQERAERPVSYVWLMEGRGYPEGNFWATCEVFSTYEGARAAAKAAALLRPLICCVYRAPLDGAKTRIYMCNSAENWGSFTEPRIIEKIVRN